MEELVEERERECMIPGPLELAMWRASSSSVVV